MYNRNPCIFACTFLRVKLIYIWGPCYTYQSSTAPHCPGRSNDSIGFNLLRWKGRAGSTFREIRPSLDEVQSMFTSYLWFGLLLGRP